MRMTVIVMSATSMHLLNTEVVSGCGGRAFETWWEYAEAMKHAEALAVHVVRRMRNVKTFQVCWWATGVVNHSGGGYGDVAILWGGIGVCM